MDWLDQLELNNTPQIISDLDNILSDFEENINENFNINNKKNLEENIEENQENLEENQENQEDVEDIDLNTNENTQIKKKINWEPLDNTWQKILLTDKFQIYSKTTKTELPNALNIASGKSGFTYSKIINAITQFVKNMNPTDFNQLTAATSVNTLTKPQFIKSLRAGEYDLNQPPFLKLISNAIKIDLIIMTSDYKILNLSNPDKLQQKLIILYYDNKASSYLAIGLAIKKTKTISIFITEKLSSEISIIIDKNTFYLKHLKQICEKTDTSGKSSHECKEPINKLTLNKILNLIEENIHSKLNQQSKKIVLGLIKNWMQNNEYLNSI